LKIPNLSTTGSQTCSSTINAAGGICIGGTHKRCFCGFYGAACDQGCPNGCSGAGTCASFNTCSCNAKREGADCSLVQCPKGDQGKYCSAQGKCLADATCQCNDGFEGANCGTKIILKREDKSGGFPDAGQARGLQGIRLGAGLVIPSWLVAVFYAGLFIMLASCAGFARCLGCCGGAKGGNNKSPMEIEPSA
jgi:hypothetical protein